MPAVTRTVEAPADGDPRVPAPVGAPVPGGRALGRGLARPTPHRRPAARRRTGRSRPARRAPSVRGGRHAGAGRRSGAPRCAGSSAAGRRPRRGRAGGWAGAGMSWSYRPKAADRRLGGRTRPDESCARPQCRPARQEARAANSGAHFGAQRPFRGVPKAGQSKAPTASPLAGACPTVSTQCAPEGIRTPNLLIRSQMLYPLSYGRNDRQAYRFA